LIGLEEGVVATITQVTIFSSLGQEIAKAPSGELAPPDNLGAVLTISDLTWKVGNKDVSKFAGENCSITATAVGKPFNGKYKIASIRGDDKVVKLAPI
jgi:hypothetical protein